MWKPKYYHSAKFMFKYIKIVDHLEAPDGECISCNFVRVYLLVFIDRNVIEESLCV